MVGLLARSVHVHTGCEQKSTNIWDKNSKAATKVTSIVFAQQTGWNFKDQTSNKKKRITGKITPTTIYTYAFYEYFPWET